MRSALAEGDASADAYVFKLLPSADPLIRSLEKVAFTSGQAPDKPNWHHFSIRERIGYLKRCQIDRRWIERHNAKVRRGILLYLAAICLAAGKCGRDGEIYNVSDGCDSNMTEYFYQVADHLGLQRPPCIDWETAKNVLSTGMLSYLRESRRMVNSKMLKELDIKLKYPNLKSGLKNITS